MKPRIVFLIAALAVAAFVSGLFLAPTKTPPGNEARPAAIAPGQTVAPSSHTIDRSKIRYATIAVSDAESPRNDTANVVELPGGSLIIVWHKYHANPEAGSDFGQADIACKTSHDGGVSWEDERIIVKRAPEDLNIQAPALCLLPNGELLMAALRAHAQDSSSMCLFRSSDLGRTWKEAGAIWSRHTGQWLQGGASGIVQLASGRLLLPFHGGTGTQWGQHNTVGCFVSDDLGYTWRQTPANVDLPMRGAMEASVAGISDGRLLMSLRTQLGTVFLCESRDQGETWSLPWSSGLTAPESCTCLRRIGRSDGLLLVWNGCEFYEPKHHHFGQRNPLSLAWSADAGRTWTRLGDMETDPESSFSDLNCTFTSKGDAIISYWVLSPPFAKAPKVSDLKVATVPASFWSSLAR